MTNHLPLCIVLGVLYAVLVPVVADAGWRVRKRVAMRRDNHPESAIQRAAGGVVADLIEATPFWRRMVTIRPLALICTVIGPALLLLAVAVLVGVIAFIFVVLLREELGELLFKKRALPSK